MEHEGFGGAAQRPSAGVAIAAEGGEVSGEGVGALPEVEQGGGIVGGGGGGTGAEAGEGVGVEAEEPFAGRRGDEGFAAARGEAAAEQGGEQAHQSRAVTRPAVEGVLSPVQDDLASGELGADAGLGAEGADRLGVGGGAGEGDADDGGVGEQGGDDVVVEAGDDVVGRGGGSGAGEDGVGGGIQRDQRLDLFGGEAEVRADRPQEGRSARRRRRSRGARRWRGGRGTGAGRWGW